MVATELPFSAIEQSVQKFPDGDGGFNSLYYIPSQPDILPPWGARIRDLALRRLALQTHGTITQGAIATFISIIASTPWEIGGEGKDPERYQELFQTAHFGAGWDSFIWRVMFDYLTQDFGALIEIIGAGDPDGPLTGAPTGIAHLDSYRCWATGNPEYPIIYQSQWGGSWHRMHWSRVIRIVDQPSPDERMMGLGFCALSRTAGITYKDILMNKYHIEKLNDLPPAGFLKLQNVPKGYMNVIRQRYDTDRVRDGASIWANIIEIEGLDANSPVEVEFLSFANLPDHFNYREHIENDVNAIALGFGVDPQDIWPLTGAPLGSGTQSKVLAAKARGKGYGYLLKRLERLNNICILPKELEFKFKWKDAEQDAERATTAKVWMDIANSASVFSSLEKRRLLADNVEAFADILLDPTGQLIELADDDPKGAQDGDITLEDFTPVDTVTPPADTGAITLEAKSVLLRQRGVPDSAGIDSALLSAPTLSTALAQRGNTRIAANKPTGLRGDITGRGSNRHGRKDIQSTRLDFEGDWADMIVAAESGDMTRSRFGIVARALLRRYGQQAYKDGLVASGVEDDLTSDDLDTVAGILSDQSGYVSPFADSLYGDEAIEPDPDGKATIWFNKSIMPFYQAGFSVGEANGIYEWVVGNTEHCEDCLRLNGQKHRLHAWIDSGWMPQSDSLECGGFNCRCSLVKKAGRTGGDF